MADPFAKFRLDGRTALVTGGGTGLGYHMTKALAEAGATVLIAARRENVLVEAVAELNKNPAISGRVRWTTADLNDRASVYALADYCAKEMGGIDIYLANAAFDTNQHLANITDEAMDDMMRVNIASNVILIRAFAPAMRQKKWGRILFSSSVSTVVTSPHEGIAMYTATKGAQNAIARTLAAELGHDNITVNSLIIGFFVTDLVRHAERLLRETQGEGAAQKFMEDFVGMTALGRAGTPDELEGLIQFLCSDAGSYVTGTNLAVDGGMSIMLRPNGMAG